MPSLAGACSFPGETTSPLRSVLLQCLWHLWELTEISLAVFPVRSKPGAHPAVF